MLPSLHAARRQTQVAACASNLRTIGQALVYYLEANQDTLPAASAGGFENLHKYVQKVTLSSKPLRSKWISGKPFIDIPWYLCPGDEIPHVTAEVEHTLPDGTKQKAAYLLSYGMNEDLSYALKPSPDGDPPEGILRKMSSVKRPSGIVSYCGAGNDEITKADTWVLTESNDVNNQTQFEVHHKTGNNFLYCDGHVSFHKVAINDPPQYGLPPFPWAWIPNYERGGHPGWEEPDYSRPAPISKAPPG